MEIEFTGQVVLEQLGLGLAIENQQADRSWSVRKCETEEKLEREILQT
jgi:hypothetical protein